MKKYKYRFKTYKEMSIEFNQKNGYPDDYIPRVESVKRYIGFNSYGAMDYLFGTELDVPPRNISGEGDVRGSFHLYRRNEDNPTASSSWTIFPGMIIRESAHPQYNKRKLVY